MQKKIEPPINTLLNIANKTQKEEESTKNIFGINSLFFYENQKFRPQGGLFVYISDFFEAVKVAFFQFISKQIRYSVSLNTLVLESIKISWELIDYFFMKIKNSDPLYIFQIFSRMSKLNFFGLCMSNYDEK